MRKIKGYIFVLILCILFMCSGCGNPESQTGQGSPDLYQDARQQADGDAAADSLPETEALLKEDQVLELGDHMAVCHIHREEFEKGMGAWQELDAGTEALPRKVWEESFRMEGETYTVLFERVSPVYDPGYETGEIDADYRLTVRGGEENILSRQTVFHYPVAFEEVHWLIDFSGDGFSDIAFYTDIYRGSGGAWSVLDILIWNAEAGCYEEKRIDGFGSLHLWNPDMSSLVVCADENDIGYWAKEMYAWVEGEWQRIGRFERVYSETEFYEMPGRGMFPYSDGYRELVCLGGEPVEEKRIEKDFYEEDAFWSDTECIWSEKYKNSVRLYPVWPEWEKATTVIGGTSIEKYIRVVSEP